MDHLKHRHSLLHLISYIAAVAQSQTCGKKKLGNPWYRAGTILAAC